MSAKFKEYLHLSSAKLRGIQINEATTAQINIKHANMNESNKTRPQAFALYIYILI
jgi:hypothetical protein